MTFLLEANVLIALVDEAFLHHDPARRWFEEHGHRAWATCPPTKNAVLRIMGHPGSPGTPAGIMPSRASLRALPGHRFWPDDICAPDAAQVTAAGLLSAHHVTDTYLLALARAHCGRIASFDRRLVTTAVPGGANSLAIIG